MQVTAALAQCPMPEGPLYTAAQVHELDSGVAGGRCDGRDQPAARRHPTRRHVVSTRGAWALPVAPPPRSYFRALPAPSQADQVLNSALPSTYFCIVVYWWMFVSQYVPVLYTLGVW